MKHVIAKHIITKERKRRKGICRVRVFILFASQFESVGSSFVSRDFLAAFPSLIHRPYTELLAVSDRFGNEFANLLNRIVTIILWHCVFAICVAT